MCRIFSIAILFAASLVSVAQTANSKPVSMPESVEGANAAALGQLVAWPVSGKVRSNGLGHARLRVK